jgi:hypothetical protein
VAQQAIQRERAAPDQVRRIFDGLLWHMIHVDNYCSAADRSAHFRARRDCAGGAPNPIRWSYGEGRRSA